MDAVASTIAISIGQRARQERPAAADHTTPPPKAPPPPHRVGVGTDPYKGPPVPTNEETRRRGGRMDAVARAQPPYQSDNGRGRNGLRQRTNPTARPWDWEFRGHHTGSFDVVHGVPTIRPALCLLRCSQPILRRGRFPHRPGREGGAGLTRLAGVLLNAPANAWHTNCMSGVGHTSLEEALPWSG